MGLIHIALSAQTGVEGTKKGGGRFRVCACTTACVHPYAQKGGWVVPPSHSSTPPRFTYRPYARLGGERATRFGRGLQFAQPLCMQMEGGPLPCPPSAQTRGGMCFWFARGPRSHAPFARKQRRGAKGFIHSPPPIRVSPLHASRGWGALLPSVRAAHCSRVTFVRER